MSTAGLLSPGLLAAATIPDALTFAIAAVICVAGALGVVVMRNPVHSALSLVMTLFGIAVLFVEQDADFLAAVQVIVYTGAIVVLFLFVIMLLGVDRKEKVMSDTFKGQRVFAGLLGLMVLAEVILLARSRWTTGASSASGPLQTSSSNVATLGKALFTTYLIPFEVTSALLVVAVVGAVVLARRPSSPAGTTYDAEPDSVGSSEAPVPHDSMDETTTGPVESDSVESDPIAGDDTLEVSIR